MSSLSFAMLVILKSPLERICIRDESRLDTGIGPLRHVISGSGYPVARQRNRTSAPTYATETLKKRQKTFNGYLYVDEMKSLICCEDLEQQKLRTLKKIELCFCMVSLALNLCLTETCHAKTKLFIPSRLNVAAE